MRSGSYHKKNDRDIVANIIDIESATSAGAEQGGMKLSGGFTG